MIKAVELSKKFDNKLALDKVTFRIPDGSVFGLVGSNGSGKSTLLRLISGIYPPDSGRLEMNGIAVFNNPMVKSQIAFLSDIPYFLPQTNLDEMAALYEKMYPNFSREEYKRLLDIFPLDCKDKLSSFSKGMQRQASLILALASMPRYLLLDEAFDGLDVVMRKVLINILLEGIEKNSITAVVSSHNLREIEEMCDHIAVIHNGKLITSGSVEEAKNNIHKFQAAFNSVPEIKVFDSLDILKTERTGSLIQIIAKGDEKEIEDFIKQFDPIFIECIEPTLEETFIYELEVLGYDIKNILE